MNIGSSVLAIKIQNNIQQIDNTITKQTEKLASGIRINRASDDATGLKISEKMRAQIRGLEMSLDNATDGISMLQTADGGLSKIGDLLQRMNELSIKAVNGIHTQSDLDKISIEYEQCKREIDRIAETTTFNGKQLLNVNVGETKVKEIVKITGTDFFSARVNGKIDFSTIGDGNEFIIKRDDREYRFQFSYKDTASIDGSIKVRLSGEETNQEKAEKLTEAIEDNIGDLRADVYIPDRENNKIYTISIIAQNKVAGECIDIDVETHAPIIKVGNNEEDKIYLTLKSVTSRDLDIENTSVLTSKDAENAIKKIADAINQISEVRGIIGTTQNQLEYTIKRITIEGENTRASESRIRDIDMAKEMVQNAKSKIIQESAISMLAQANQSGGMVLNLLKS